MLDFVFSLLGEGAGWREFASWVVALLTVALLVATYWSDFFMRRGSEAALPLSENHFAYYSAAYVRESVRLAEERLRELQAALAALEKKAYALMLAMAAVIVYLTANRGESDSIALNLLWSVGVAACASALAFLPFVARVSDTGMAGMPPEESNEAAQFLGDFAGGERSTQSRMLNVFTLLWIYHNAIATSEFTHRRKRKMFVISSSVAYAGLLMAGAWVFLGGGAPPR